MTKRNWAQEGLIDVLAEIGGEDDEPGISLDTLQ